MPEECKAIDTDSGNYYLICNGVPQILLCHPLLEYFISLKNIETADIDTVDSPQALNSEAYQYYSAYFTFLKNHSYFKPPQKSQMPLNRYTGEIVQRLLANTEEIVFESTTSCNMDCIYCGYGELYRENDDREEKELSIKGAKKLIDYILNLNKADISLRAFKNQVIGFYGGEPLLNFQFILAIVDYAESFDLCNSRFNFRITTNGLLLNKYIDYLVEKNFQVVISLDGNAQHNVFRVLKDGSPSYPLVIKNVIELKKKYPAYFEKNVKFNSVIHSENSTDEVMTFFRHTFNKEPRIIELSKIGVKPSREKEFFEIYKNPSGKFNTEREHGSWSPVSKVKLLRIINTNTYYIASRYKKWLEESQNSFTVLTGTCPPFKQKVFCTADGKILPCERIPRSYYLGEICEKEVRIKFSEIADKYNRWYEKVKHQCNKCRDSQYCGNCIFYIDFESNNAWCSKFKTNEAYDSDLSDTISILEKYPYLYSDLLGRNEKKMSPVTNKKSSYWLYLHPYTYLNIKKDCAIIYNTLSGSILEYTQDREVIKILKRLDSNLNLYVVGIEKKKLPEPVKKLIMEIRSTFSGDTYKSSFSIRKPFQFKPLPYLDISKSKITFQSKLKLLEGDELPCYLDTANLYINNLCNRKCSKCSQAYKQFLFCNSKKINQKELDISVIDKLIKELKNTSVFQLNVLGGNIFYHSKFKELTVKLNHSTFSINYFLHYLNLSTERDNGLMVHLLQSEKNSLTVLVDFPLRHEILLPQIDYLKKTGLKVILHFVVESEGDIKELEKTEARLDEDEFVVTPFYNGNNYDFFERTVFITKQALKESQPSMRDIFAQMVVNTLDFAKLTIMSNGKIYANVNNPKVGKLSNDSIITAIKNEMVEGKSWGKVRKNVYPCKSCPYNAVCPPISGYEYALGRFDCCNIFQHIKHANGKTVGNKGE